MWTHGVRQASIKEAVEHFRAAGQAEIECQANPSTVTVNLREFAMGLLAIPPKKDKIWMNLDCLLFPTLFTTHLLLDCQNTSHEFQRRHKMLQVSPQ